MPLLILYLLSLITLTLLVGYRKQKKHNDRLIELNRDLHQENIDLFNKKAEQLKKIELIKLKLKSYDTKIKNMDEST